MFLPYVCLFMELTFRNSKCARVRTITLLRFGFFFSYFFHKSSSILFQLKSQSIFSYTLAAMQIQSKILSYFALCQENAFQSNVAKRAPTSLNSLHVPVMDTRPQTNTYRQGIPDVDQARKLEDRIASIESGQRLCLVSSSWRFLFTQQKSF